MAGKRLDIFFDFGSPFAYMLSKLLPAVAERASLVPVWRPIDLLQLEAFHGGLPYSQKKRAYVFVDVVRSAEFHDVHIQVPEPFPVESGRANRLACALAGDPAVGGVVDRVREEFLDATWARSEDIGDDAILSACLEAADLDAARWLAASAAPEAESALAANLAEAEEAGVFGVPTMLFEGELFWGVDSLPVLEWRASAP